ncbi:OLC1v1018458C1 [Oldenlandia corymbosa var. corymbosa]|uniref:OLC1v1018458C1 n=1 Tax=Oldenlandia corymbosa var. corymbosa TaxID=529605 RepID=A0AAV1EBZ1_OLDCO|nr:OLC1v1018458C1 [Oldenlandia corymbosa var. corymbosa]
MMHIKTNTNYNMRGGGGGGVGDFARRLLLQNHQKTHLIRQDDDHDHTSFLFHNHHVAQFDGDDHHSNSHIQGDQQFKAFHDQQEEEEEEEASSMERTMFWESQQSLLEEILEQYKSNYSKLRDELRRHIELSKNAKFCECMVDPNLDDCCSNCLRRQVVNLLCKKGFHATLVTSSWKKTPTVPGGKHEYIEVIVSTQGRKRRIKFIIEVEFKDEFKMAKACKEYNNLVNLLPPTYIGKAEHLDAIVRVMCEAAKRSTSENKMHLGPWRKRSFMQMKWSASSSSSSSISSTHESKQEEGDGVISKLLVPATNLAVRVA